MADDVVIQRMVDAVSRSRIEDCVRRLQDFETRYALHDSSLAAAEFIHSELLSLGIDDVTAHNFQPPFAPNIVAVIPGETTPDEFVIIGGHYDSTTGGINNDDCPGADDNGSGTAAVLECARILSSYEFDRSVIIIAFSAEEFGLRGSAAWVQDAVARGMNITAAVILDMVGHVASTDVMDLDVIDDGDSHWLSNAVSDAASRFVPALPVVRTVDSLLTRPGNSDNVSFWNAGFSAVWLTEDIDQRSPHLHTTGDVIGQSFNSPLLTELVTKTALATVAELAGAREPIAPQQMVLHPNFPNPFNPSTTIRYDVATDGTVRLTVYDVRGRPVRKLYDGWRPAGEYDAVWNGRDDRSDDVASGVYFYRLETAQSTMTRKMVLVR